MLLRQVSQWQEEESQLAIPGSAHCVMQWVIMLHKVTIILIPHNSRCWNRPKIEVRKLWIWAQSLLPVCNSVPKVFLHSFCFFKVLKLSVTMPSDVYFNTLSHYSRLSYSHDGRPPDGLGANSSPQMCVDQAGQHGASKRHLNWLPPLKSATFIYNLYFWLLRCS